MGSGAFLQWRSSLKGVSGCSSGCFTALAILLGVTMDQLQGSFPLANVMPRLTRDIHSIGRHLGASKTDILVDVASAILDYGGLSSSVTLEHLYRFTRVDCKFVCTSLSRRCRVYLSHASHPHIRVVDAIAASCCIPGVFRPVCIDGDYMVDGNLLESTPVPFPTAQTLYIVVSAAAHMPDQLDASSYLNTLMKILTRFDEQQSRIPHHRRILVSDSSAVFDPFITDDNASNIRFNGFVQTISFLALGNGDALLHIINHCIHVYIRLSVHIDLTTSDEEEIPPLNES
jgi:predicted acylesterase/phospholipase RssA